MFKLNYILLISLFISLSSCNKPVPSTPMKNCKDCNLIVISLTSLRKDRMSYYGYPKETTPNISSFFKNSFRFDNVIAPAALTYTDAMSLFYSVSPQVHQAYVRARKNYTFTTLLKYPSLADVLSKAGYKTAAFVSDEDYEFGWGLGKTFDLYFDRAHYVDYGIQFKPFTYSVGTKQLVPQAIKWLEKNQNEKKFLFLQAYDLHCPFNPSPSFRNKFVKNFQSNIPLDQECFMAKDKMYPIRRDGIDKFLMKSFFAYVKEEEKTYYLEKKEIDILKDLYDAEIAEADFNLAPLFEKIKQLKLEKNTIVVLLTEHGDYQGENGYFFKTAANAEGNLHKVNLNIPFILKLPELNDQIAQPQIIQLIDIAPSIIDLLGLKKPSTMQGKSFKTVLGSNQEINDYSYGYSIRYGFVKLELNQNYYYKLETLQNHEWKLNHSEQYEFPKRNFIKEEYFLFDLSNDPDEKNNLATKNKTQLEKLKIVLKQKRDFYSDGVTNETNH